ncbi:hypothetical protein SEA_ICHABODCRANE_263 [Streptomyces phage IchabodCrane]|nr:hypothetical protein SEA_ICHABODCRANE_10 [Streptomyces phage IchabodCrane]QFP97540.1 hypothetical protein SEA_ICHABODCRANE_263 [Streptomyces phage IchabodCrane]QGH78899.1 hypothetical protein SEA_TOMSAWYER_11 [Streptomyces phage TomSawyer]QGH79119.1 hypothetical protein SEA_TOMSAWYER_276 [Streptomyces phage TomSawyer]
MDAIDIVKIFIDNGLDMNLGQAADVARQINNTVTYEIEQKQNGSYTSGYNLGITEGRMQKANEIRNEGLTVTKAEMIRLRGAEDFAYNQAREAAPKIIKEIGKLYKIMCIKRLRNDFPFLGLKDAKDIIDAEVKKITDAEDAAMRTRYDYSYDSYDYGCGPDCSICG